MTDNITLQNLLPRVFLGMEDFDSIRRSQVWLKSPVVFERGCRVCVAAESGSGKSSLLSFIYGNRSDYEGTILFDGVDTSGFSTEKWCDLRINSLALLPQELRLFPELTVMENIQIKNRLTAHKTEDEIMALLRRLGIEGKAGVMCGKLSIGQQQRVAIVRTVCQPFDFIFLDEPVSHLDEKNNRIVADIVCEEAARNNAGIVATSVGHHLLLPEARYLAL